MDHNEDTDMQMFFFKEKEMKTTIANKIIHKRILEELESLKKKISKEYAKLCSDLCNEKLPEWHEEAAQLIILRMIKIIIDGVIIQDYKIKEVNNFSARI